jgi:hypothetical protein
MTHETRTVISDKRIPKGCTVTYHELRGYDSPERWYEARSGRKKLGAFPNKDAAIRACKRGKVVLKPDVKFETLLELQVAAALKHGGQKHAVNAIAGIFRAELGKYQDLLVAAERAEQAYRLRHTESLGGDIGVRAAMEELGDAVRAVGKR